MPKRKKPLMDNAAKGSRAERPWFSDGGVPVREGVYFYLIIAVSLVFPILIAVCVAFADWVVTILVTTALLSLLLFLIHMYHKIKRQVREFHDALENLHLLEGSHEISILGGLISLRIEDAEDGSRPSAPDLPMIEHKREE